MTAEISGEGETGADTLTGHMEDGLEAHSEIPDFHRVVLLDAL